MQGIKNRFESVKNFFNVSDDPRDQVATMMTGALLAVFHVGTFGSLALVGLIQLIHKIG